MSTAHAGVPVSTLHDIWASVRADHYEQPTAQQLVLSRQLFAELLKNGVSPELSASFKKIKLELTDYPYNGEYLIVIREYQAPYLGAGLFVVRPNGNGIMLQAPHGISDLHTGKLSIQMMQEANYSALALNSIARSYQANGKKVDADMAHLTNTYFISFSQAFANQYPDGRVVQLHGFGNDKRRETDNVSIIVSAGTKSHQQRVQQQADCLRRSIAPQARAYPGEINVLGGTTNSIGHFLRNMGFTGFMHYEMNLELRQLLTSDITKRKQLSQCITSDG